MDEQAKIITTSTATNVQLLEIKPAANGMSFSAQLEKFYLKSELLNNGPETLAKANETVFAQHLLKEGPGIKPGKA